MTDLELCLAILAVTVAGFALNRVMGRFAKRRLVVTTTEASQTPQGFLPAMSQRRTYREQHYGFAHGMLPASFFVNPGFFFQAFTGSTGVLHLRHYWNEVGVTAGDGPMNVGELAVSALEMEGRAGCLISLPGPIAPPEAHYVALLEPSRFDAEHRYFVLEKADPDCGRPAITGAGPAAERAVLCEWLPGRKRRNHDVWIERPDRETFLAAVQSQLSDERYRREVGAPVVAARTWDPAVDNDPGSASRDAGAYRLQICLFAFHLLPRLLLAGGGGLVRAGLYQARQAVDQAWASSGRICSEMQLPDVPEKPSLRVVQLGGRPRLLVSFPRPVSQPEPSFALIPEAEDGPMLLAEMVQGRDAAGVLTSVCGQERHAVIGTLQSLEETSFMAAAERHVVGRGGPADLPELMRHLTLYAEIAHQTRGRQA